MAPARPLAVVLLSGGLDSCVAAAEARRDGHDLALLHANYGQRTEARELSCFHALADRMGVPRSLRLVVDLRHLGKIGGSALTDRRIAVEASPLSRASTRAGETRTDRAAPSPGVPVGGRQGAGRSTIPLSYVPFRNSHFLAVAVSWAEVLGAAAIYVGAVEEDSSGYPDCREVYFEAFQRVVDLGTRPETRVRIVRPLIRLDKAAIVRRGLALGAPLELTWSCYTESDVACGVCDSCVLRLRGFEMAGARDPLPYAAAR